jgi:hypothetical protein
LPLAVAGCDDFGVHPLSDSGSALFLVDDKPIYAADVLDADLKPVLPRQAPFEKRVQLFMTSAGAPDRGAYLDVQMSPPNTVLLLSDPEDAEKTCEHLSGAFRCTAGEDGLANFLVRSESDWSGTITLSLVGRNRGETGEVIVSPAGLPDQATDFELIVEGLDGVVVPARFTSLDCVLNPVPDTTFDKWPEGKTRVRAAQLRAGFPPDTPGVVEHAPVYAQSFDPEVFLTLDPSCPPPSVDASNPFAGTSRLRVQLDGGGVSPSFFFCFSDLGTQGARLSARSGQKSTERTIDVEVEPRLLRVVTLTQQLTVGEIDAEVAALSAFNSDIAQVAFVVDVRSSDPSVLHVSSPTVQLPLAGEIGNVRVTPLKAGTATIQVTPQLLATPRCESEPITVVP